MPMLPTVIENTGDRFAAFQAALTAALTTRQVFPGFMPSSARNQAELNAGVVNIVLRDEKDYGQGRGQTARSGTTGLTLICHLQVAQPDGCDRAALSNDVRAAELALLEEIKTFCRSNPVPGLEVLLTETQFSRQLEAPMGWLVMDIELRPPLAATH